MFKRLFSQGFRIFFLAACLFSLVSMAIWEGYLWLQAFADGSAFPPAMAPHLWHAHEMIFGYGGAVLAGFFLTAVPNWTGGKSAPERFIALVFALWLAGRLGFWFSASLPPTLVAVADLAFVPALGVKIAAQLLARPKPQQMIFLLALSLLWIGNLMCHLEWLGVLRDGVAPGLRAGLLTLVAMIAILGGGSPPALPATPWWPRGAKPGCHKTPRDWPMPPPPRPWPYPRLCCWVFRIWFLPPSP